MMPHPESTFKVVASAIDAGAVTMPQIRERTGLSTNQVKNAMSWLRKCGTARTLNETQPNRYNPARYALTVGIDEIVGDRGAGYEWRDLWQVLALPMPQLVPVRARVRTVKIMSAHSEEE